MIPAGRLPGADSIRDAGRDAGVLASESAWDHPGEAADPLPAKSSLKACADLTDEPCVEGQLDSNEIWEALQTLLPSGRERRLAYLPIPFCKSWNEMGQNLIIIVNIGMKLLEFHQLS